MASYDALYCGQTQTSAQPLCREERLKNSLFVALGDTATLILNFQKNVGTRDNRVLKPISRGFGLTHFLGSSSNKQFSARGEHGFEAVRYQVHH